MTLGLRVGVPRQTPSSAQSPGVGRGRCTPLGGIEQSGPNRHQIGMASEIIPEGRECRRNRRHPDITMLLSLEIDR